MILAFASREIRDVCERELEAKSLLGVWLAKKLQRRIADLRAARSPVDILIGSPRVIEEEGEQAMLVDYAKGHSLIFAANHLNNPLDNDNRVNWAKVNRIKIVSLGVHRAN